jgi:hypothetical protein
VLENEILSARARELAARMRENSLRLPDPVAILASR